MRAGGFANKDAERESVVAATPGLRARLAAQAILSDVLAGGHSLDERFDAGATPNRALGLDERDKALARSIATTAVRRFGALRRAQSLLLDRGLPRNSGQLEWVLLTALAQILFMEAADHAAVDLAVRSIRLEARTAGFAGLVNGVLRNAVRRRDELLSGLDPLVDETPAWLAARWRKAWGEARARAIAAAHLLEPTLDLTALRSAGDLAGRIEGRLLPTQSLRVLAHDPVTTLPGFAEGEFWVQDAAAALPARLLGARAGERALDLCAAPGGKTAQLAAAGARTTAVDRSAERLKTLKANLDRLGLEAEISVADAATFSAPAFDCVLVDPPCSATGTIRRHPDVRWTKKSGDLDTLSRLQARILDRAAALVRPGGRLVYCVCSIEPEEGEAQVAALLRRNPDMVRAPIEAGECGVTPELVNAQGELRTLPCHWPDENPRLAGLDGFFAARFVRRS